MDGITLAKARIREGVWEGVLKAPAGPLPPLEATLEGQILQGLEIAPIEDRPGRWRLRLPIPAEALNEGVQTFAIRATGDADLLAHFTIVTGVPLEDDIRAELDLLRAELELLKQVLRRHIGQNPGGAEG